MEMILLLTCVLMWAFVIGTSILLMLLAKDISRIEHKQEEQAEELDAVEVATYRMIKGEDNG